jgi:hypothetical protein
MNVTVVAFEDCMTSAVAGLLDAFALAERLSRANRAPPWRHQVRLASVDGHPVRGFGNFPITPPWPIAQCGDSEIVIVPAVLGDIETVLGRERKPVDWLAISMKASAISANIRIVRRLPVSGRLSRTVARWLDFSNRISDTGILRFTRWPSITEIPGG